MNSRKGAGGLTQSDLSDWDGRRYENSADWWENEKQRTQWFLIRLLLISQLYPLMNSLTLTHTARNATEVTQGVGHSDPRRRSSKRKEESEHDLATGCHRMRVKVSDWPSQCPNDSLLRRFAAGLCLPGLSMVVSCQCGWNTPMEMRTLVQSRGRVWNNR